MNKLGKVVARFQGRNISVMNPEQVESRGKRIAQGKEVKPRFFYGYVVAAAGFGVWLIGFGTISTFGVFFKPVLTEFGWTRAETALAYSLSMIVAAALAITMGWLTDRLGPRVVVTVFGSFLGICYLLMSRVTAIWHFQLNYGLVGAIGVSTLAIPAMATVARWFVKRRGLMIGITQSGMGIGGLVFAPLAGWLILTYDWRSAYTILGIIALVGIITSGIFLKRDPRDVNQLPDGVDEVVAQEVNKQSLKIQTAGLSLREAIRTSQFWVIAGLYFSFGFCRSTFIAHIAAHVQDLGFSLAHGANVLALLTASSIVGRIGMGRVADMIGNRQTFMISYAATTVILIWGLIADDLWGLYLFAVVFGFGWGAQAVLRFAVTSEAFGSVSLGVVLGVLGLAEASAGAFGSYFAGYIFDAVGNYQPTFWMGITFSVVGIMLASVLKPAIGQGR